MLVLWIVTALPFAFVCVLLFILPALSRRTQFFAVTVPADFRDGAEARAIVRRYRLQAAVHCAIGLIGMIFVAARNAPNLLELPILWPVAGSMVAVVLAHREALRYAMPATGVRQASLQPRPRPVPGGPLVWAGPFVLLAASAIFIGLHWNEIPARFPIHWGFDNQPNGWGVRSIGGVYMPAMIGTLVCFLMLTIVWLNVRSSRGSAAMLNLTVRLILVLTYFLAALFGWLTARLPLGRGAPSAAFLGIVMGSVAAIAGAAIFFGIRAKTEPEEGNEWPSAPASVLGLAPGPRGDNTDDRNWVGGLFYFNPEDPALFIEKRIGIGYDLNFGRPGAWVFLGVLLSIPATVVLLGKL